MFKEINYNDGEIHAWSGGDCPVHPKSLVKVASINCLIKEVAAEIIDWSQPLLFRVTEQHIEPPKPLELWVNVHENGGVSAYHTAGQSARWAANTTRTIRVIEVTE